MIRVRAVFDARPIRVRPGRVDRPAAGVLRRPDSPIKYPDEP